MPEINNSIKIGFCVAYDWHFLAHSLPLVYEAADIICLSIDKDRVSWANRSYPWDEEGFNKLISSVDPLKKIFIYEDNFHLPNLGPAQNEVRQRQLMARKMGTGGWHIQLDCDEYFLDFGGFVDYLKSFRDRRADLNVCCQFITLFKKVDGGFLFVYPDKAHSFEFFQIASRMPQFEYGRRNGNFNVYSPFFIIHQSWARTEKEILEKLSNWGHKDDFNPENYFEFWKAVGVKDLDKIRSFHPINPESWPALRLMESADIGEAIDKFKHMSFPSLSPVSRSLKNSRLASTITSRLAFLYKMVFFGGQRETN